VPGSPRRVRLQVLHDAIVLWRHYDRQRLSNTYKHNDIKYAMTTLRRQQETSLAATATAHHPRRIPWTQSGAGGPATLPTCSQCTPCHSAGGQRALIARVSTCKPSTRHTHALFLFRRMHIQEESDSVASMSRSHHLSLQHRVGPSALHASQLVARRHRQTQASNTSPDVPAHVHPHPATTYACLLVLQVPQKIVEHGLGISRCGTRLLVNMHTTSHRMSLHGTT
jgi:hypothetical protein